MTSGACGVHLCHKRPIGIEFHMSDIQTQMSAAVSSFVERMTDLARRVAVNALRSAQHGPGALRPAAVSTGASPSPRARSGKGKRTPADLEALSRRFVGYVRAHPGLRIEQINKQLGTSTKDLALPIRKAIADGVLVTKGRKRSTTYHTPGRS
jgi:hypothetical protein